MNWWDYGIGRAHDPTDNASGGELGIDLSTPLGTVITCPWPSHVTYAGASASTGWIVKVLTSIPDYGSVYAYFLHMTTCDVSAGQNLDAGARLGLSGGMQPGAGQWPHVEFGMFHDSAYAYRYWGFVTGSTLDPTPVILALRKGSATVSVPAGLGGGFSALYAHLGMTASVTVPETYFNDHESVAVFSDGTVFHYDNRSGVSVPDLSRSALNPSIITGLVAALQAAKNQPAPAPAPPDPVIADKAARYDAIKAALAG